MILNPVGAIYKVFVLYFSHSSQTLPAFGVIGLPSKKTEDPQRSKGPYTMKEWPTTQPISLMLCIVSPFWMLKTEFKQKSRLTQVPPVSLTTPFGVPVVPDVYKI